MKALPSSSSAPAAEGAAPRRSPHVRPQQREQFESALRRHLHEDQDPAPNDNPALPQGQPLMVATPTPAPAERPVVDTAAGAMPRTAATQDAVSTHLRALGVAGGSTTQAHWQLQWAGATTAVQQVDLRRSDDGRLHLDMSGSVQAGEPARLARLRDRVAARVAAPEVLVRSQRAGTPGPGSRRHADEDESGA